MDDRLRVIIHQLQMNPTLRNNDLVWYNGRMQYRQQPEDVPVIEDTIPITRDDALYLANHIRELEAKLEAAITEVE